MTTQSTITEELLPVSGPVLVGQVFDDAVSGSVDVSQVAVRDISNKILAIIYEYRLKKFDHSMESNAPGTSSFLAVLDKYVETGRRVQMCLPAFPFKSANKVYKALGPLPDKAEELALKRLHTMCSRIEMVYPPGALLTIISDGLVYSGIPNSSLSVIQSQRPFAYEVPFRQIFYAFLTLTSGPTEKPSGP